MSKCKEYNLYNVLCKDCDYPSNINCSRRHDLRNLKEDVQRAIVNDYEMKLVTYDDEEYQGTVLEKNK